MTKRARRPTGQTIAWEIDVPLLGNRLVVLAVAKAFFLAAFLMWALLAFLFAVQGEWDLIGTMAVFVFAITGGVVAVGLLAAALIFGNRLHYRFRLDDAGATCERADRRAARVDTLAVVLGVLSGKPGVVGSGLLSAAQASIHASWASVASVTPHPSLHAVGLANVWRTTVILYCPPERWQEILAFVAARTAGRAAPRRKNPAPRLLLRTALVVAATTPLFLLPERIDLFAPLFVLCFALASVWLLPVLAWAVFAGLLAVAVEAWLAAAKPFRSMITGETLRSWDVFGPDDWIGYALAFAGSAWLVRLGVLLLTGRVVSALAGDFAEMDDE
ncbi:MAG: hypothetical protein LWW93_15880 [Hyphomicrobiales bacterium]|nr:hypothetical protein [Hyphomicrobiales bacterium]